MNTECARQCDDAGILSRMLGYLVDVGAMVVFPYTLVRLVIAPYLGNNILWPVVVGGFFVYQVYFVWKGGQTIGGRLMGIRVVTINHKSPSFIRAVIRGFGLVFMPFTSPGISPFFYYPALTATFVLALVKDHRNGMRRTVWDHLAGTVVVKIPERATET